MKTFTNQCTQVSLKPLALVFALLLAATQLMAQNLQAVDQVRCSPGGFTTAEGNALTATVDEGFYTANIAWFTQPFYGAAIETGPVLDIAYLEQTTTYYVDYIDPDNLCSECERVKVRAIIFDDVIENNIFYESTNFCNSADAEFIPTIVGTEGGTFSIDPASDLLVSSETGAINPYEIAHGTYSITYTPVEITGCDNEPVTINIIITDAPVQPEISYAEDAYCSSSVPVSVTRTGEGGGSYSVIPSGLTINSTNGTITPETSQTGTYTVTYLVPGGGGCAPVSATTEVSIIQLPVITSFSYESPVCGSIAEAQLPSLEVENDYTPGATPFSYSGGGTLALNAETGAIDPSSSVAGTYTITYTIPAAAPCGSVVETTSITIHPIADATIAVDKTQEFKDEADPIITFTGSVGPAPYTFTYRIDLGTGENLIEGLPTTITTADDQTATATVEQSTEVEGIFTYVLLAVEDDNGCEVDIVGQLVEITILGIPDTDFIYAGSPYCTNGGVATPTGSTAGTFSYSGTGLSLNTSTGVVTLETSTAGTYEVTHTLNGYSSMAVIVITRLPVATFSYASASYCPTDGNVEPNVTNDIGIFTANDPSVIFAEGDGVPPGTIDAVFTPPGTYTITNTIQSGNGCAEVSASTEITISASPNYTGDRAYEICSGATTAITHDSDIVGTTFSWTISEVTGSITGQSAGSGATIEQTLTNPSNTEIGTVSYMVTPSGGDCGAGVPTVIVVTVYPRPAVPTAGNLTVTYDAAEHTASASSSTMTQGSEVAVIDWYTASTGGDATTAPTGTVFGTYTAWAEARYASTGCISSSRTLVTLTIEQKELTVVDALVATRDYDGTTDAVITGATLSGVETDDVVVLGNHTSGTFASKNVGTGISVATSPMSISGVDAFNYTLTQPTLSGNITQKALTAASTIADKVYDGSAVTGTVSLGEVTGLVSSETLVITPSATDYPNAIVESDKATTISYNLADGTNGGLATNYSMANLATTGNITPVMLTVTADDIIRGVGETTPAYTYTMTGFVNSETEQELRDASALSGSVSFTDNTGGSTAAGSYTITPVITALTATNYSFTAATGTLTITEVVVEADGGTARAGYNTLADAYTAINDGTHTGEIAINIYASTSETSSATLNASGTGSASYTSVSLVPHNNVTITGSESPLMILGN
jgi:hypothetical protein